MPALNLKKQNESEVREELEESVKYFRERNYDLERDYSGFLVEFIGGMRYFMESNKPLAKGLTKAVQDSGLNKASIADFCCGSGKGTMRFARKLKKANFHGFDVFPIGIANANKRSRGNPRVNFSVADVYKFNDDHEFEVITFHRACGTMSDKVMQYGMNKRVPIIAGRFCCYQNIPDEFPKSKNMAQNLSLKIVSKLYRVARNVISENYMRSGIDSETDLLSEFARDDLGIDEEELKKIASTAVDAKLGSKVVDLNRVMKLIERGYNVDYDEENHIVIATRKDH